MNQPALAVSQLVREFPVSQRGRTRTLTAVDSVSFDVWPGETVALIGESGSGKSTLARCTARLIEPTSGEIMIGSQCLSTVARRSLWKAYRGLQMVFQDPTEALNPRMTVRAIIEEPLRLHTRLDAAGRRREVDALLQQVTLPLELAARYPRQLSGGECQRVAIGRALAVNPTVLLLDEPTSSLDISVRGQIIELLQALQIQRRLAYLFISHDLEVVRRIADRVLVMYLGAIVEQGTAEEIFGRPTHPYTRALLSSATVAEYGRSKSRFRLVGEISSPFDLPEGCRLSPRCPLAVSTCSVSPPMSTALSPTHVVWCPVTAGSTERREANGLIA